MNLLVYLPDDVVGFAYSPGACAAHFDKPQERLECATAEVPCQIAFFDDGASSKAFVAGWNFAFNEGVLSWLHLPVSVGCGLFFLDGSIVAAVVTCDSPAYDR